MANKLIQLPDFTYTSLDFDTIINDIKALIREHPEYNNEWDDFLESNAGRMFTEITSYIVEKLAARVDWNTREMFVSTATQRQSLINILKLINHKPELPKASKVNVKMKLTKWVEPFSLSNREQILGYDTNGQPIKFECMQLASDGKPDYDFVYTVDTGDTNNRIMEIYNIPFYAGVSVSENDIFMEGIDNESFTLNRSPVIENSVRVYSLTSGKQFVEVDSFITPEAQQNDVPLNLKTIPYIIEIDANNKATVNFGPASLVMTPDKNERLEVKYRVGGGAKTNIVANAINMTKTYNVGGERATVLYTNPNPATGGADEENLELAKLTAPISLRSANKTVTNEDYVSHLEDLQYVLKVSVIGKENEPEEIYEDFGYFLPSLETWIYIAPNRENWETTSPKLYNKTMLIGRPYDRHDWIDYEDIELTALEQTTVLKKLRKYSGFARYVTLFDNLEATPTYLAADSFIEDVDYTIDEVRSEFTRISSVEGGSIPDEDRTLRVLYIYDDTWEEHRNNTVFTFTADTVQLDTQPNGIYPAYGVTVQSPDLTETYEEGIDYTINYNNSQLTRLPTGDIGVGSSVIIRQANHWAQGQNDLSEENDILSGIENKKMICVDNKIQDAKFGTFDIAATIYCYKNLRSTVEAGLEDYIRSLYTLDKREFWDDIRREEIAANIFSFDGVRYAEISYLGRDYVAYRKESLGQISESDLQDMNGLNVEHRIECRYDEILVLADDEWEGAEISENKRHGLIFRYMDST